MSQDTGCFSCQTLNNGGFYKEKKRKVLFDGYLFVSLQTDIWVVPVDVRLALYAEVAACCCRSWAMGYMVQLLFISTKFISGGLYRLMVRARSALPLATVRTQECHSVARPEGALATVGTQETWWKVYTAGKLHHKEETAIWPLYERTIQPTSLATTNQRPERLV